MTAADRNTNTATFALQMLAQVMAWPDTSKLPKAELVELLQEIVLMLTGDET